jgi:hypothetical protein
MTKIVAACTCIVGMFCVLPLSNTAADPNRDSLPEEVARACGIERFPEVEALRFTFNVKAGERRVTRVWMWEPGPDRVVELDETGTDTLAHYLRSELEGSGAESLRDVDAKFINDQYWLLFPFHLVWDEFESIDVGAGESPLPSGDGTARKIVVTYPPGVGYTPGDVYDLYVGDDDRIVEWAYHRGGSPEPKLEASWTDYRRVGPLTLSLTRPGIGSDFRVWFSDVAVRRRGAESWTGPE